MLTPLSRLLLVASAGLACSVVVPRSEAASNPSVTIPPLPSMESVIPPPGWSPEAPVVRHMPLTLLRLPRTNLSRAKFPAIDFHVHGRGLNDAAGYARAIKLMDDTGMAALINLNGGTGAALDAVLKAGAAHKDRIANFITFSIEGINEPGWSQRFAAEMERAFKAGALGMKVSKELGHTARRPDGSYIQADDPLLDPIWEMAAKYNRPIMIHLGDSIGRYYPIGPLNERYEAGLWHRPGDTSFNYYNNNSPTYQMIEEARENMHRKHPKTRFVNAHLAMLYYDPEKLAKFLDTFPNADVEISATLQDLGRAPRMWREFIIKYQDRILHGTDGNLDRGIDEFWTPHWRTLETYDEYFEHPAQIRTEGGSPGHGRWNISGLGLPDEVLKKIYYQNALRHLPELRATVEKQLAGR